MKRQGFSQKAALMLYQNPKVNKAAVTFHKSLKEVSGMLDVKPKKKK